MFVGCSQDAVPICHRMPLMPSALKAHSHNSLGQSLRIHGPMEMSAESATQSILIESIRKVMVIERIALSALVRLYRMESWSAAPGFD